MPKPKTCLQVKWYLESVLNFLENSYDPVTEDTMEKEVALAAVQKAEDPDYHSVGLWERMQTWADVAQETIYPALTAALPRTWNCWWSSDAAKDVLNKHGIEDTEMLRALVSILEHNLLSRQRGSVPVMIPSKDKPEEEIRALLSFAALAPMLLRYHRGCCEEKLWCRRVTSALDIFRVADEWKWDNFQYVGCVLVLTRTSRMFCDEMLSHRNLRKILLKLTRVLPNFMVDKLAEAAERRIARLASTCVPATEEEERRAIGDKSAEVAEEAQSALATIFSLPDTGHAHGTVALLRELWSLRELLEEVRASSADGENRRILVLVCELIGAGLPQGAHFVREIATLKTSDLETLVRDSQGAGVRLLLAALSDRMRFDGFDSTRNDLVRRLLTLLRTAESGGSNAVAWWLGLGSPHSNWDMQRGWSRWWQKETPHPQTLRQQLGRSLREAWLYVASLEFDRCDAERQRELLEEQKLLSSPSTCFADRSWESEEETGGEEDLVPLANHEAWPSFEEGEDCCMAVEKAVLYAQAQEQRNAVTFRVVCQHSLVPPEEAPWMGWNKLKSGRELLLVGPPRGELLPDVPAARGIRQNAFSNIIRSEALSAGPPKLCLLPICEEWSEERETYLACVSYWFCAPDSNYCGEHVDIQFSSFLWPQQGSFLSSSYRQPEEALSLRAWRLDSFIEDMHPGKQPWMLPEISELPRGQLLPDAANAPCSEGIHTPTSSDEGLIFLDT